MSDLSIRRATAADVPFVTALINAAYRGESSRAGWTTEADYLDGIRTDEDEVRSLISTGGSMIVLCVRDGDVIGTVHLRHEGASAYLGMFVVQPTLQGAGVGKWFLDQAEQAARAAWGVSRITMQVLIQREELIAFYERRGYRRTGARAPFPSDAPSTPLVDGLEFEKLEKELS